MKFFNRKSIKEINEERKNQLTNDMLVFVEKNLHDEPRIHKIVNEMISCSECRLDFDNKYGISFELPTVKLKFTTENSKHGKIAPENRGSLRIVANNVSIERGEDSSLTQVDMSFSRYNDSYTFALSGGYYTYRTMGTSSGFREDGETIVQHINEHHEKEFNAMLDLTENELAKYNEKDNVM